MKIIDRLLATGIILCFFLNITACGYSKRERELMSQYSKQAKINAKNYILQKYGFDPDITDIYLEKTDSGPIIDFSPSPTSWAYVGIKKGGKKFYVYITGEKSSADGYDNYQLDVIRQALMENVKIKLNAEPIGYSIYYGEKYSSDNKYNGLVSKFYDGTNLKDILSEQKLGAVFEYIDPADLKSIYNTSYFNDYLKDGIMLFVKYTSMNSFKRVSTHLYNIFGTPQVDELYKNAIYINNALLMYNTSHEYYEFSLKEYDGLSYFVPNSNEKVEFTKIPPEDPAKWRGRGTMDARIMSDSYTVKAIEGPIYVFFPISKINNPDKLKDITLGISYTYNGERYYSANSLVYDKVGEYYYFILYLRNYSDIKFVILGDTK